MASSAKSGLHIGIDLGGSKIEIIALDEQGQTRTRHRVPTPRFDYDATLRAIVALIVAVETDLGQQATVGIAMPGTLSPATNLVKNANSTWLNGRPLDQDLKALLKRPLRFANDADCFALSEAHDGAGAAASSVFGVILGTGVGAGIVVQGCLVAGPNGIAGEWGHNPLPWPDAQELPGPNCYCGRDGCIETWLSGPALTRDHERHGGMLLDATAIATAAASGDSLAQAALARYENRLARALATIINILDPQVIVLGGGLSNLARLYERVPEQWHPYVFSDQVDTQLMPPRHGDSSGVRGAAWLGAEP